MPRRRKQALFWAAAAAPIWSQTLNAALGITEAKLYKSRIILPPANQQHQTTDDEFQDIM